MSRTLNKPDIRLAEFRTRYRAEIAARPESLATLWRFAEAGPITLLFAAHEELHNNAVVLRQLLIAEKRNVPTSVKTGSQKTE